MTIGKSYLVLLVIRSFQTFYNLHNNPGSAQVIFVTTDVNIINNSNQITLGNRVIH
ncbi:hypothetical protein [Spirosoma oryzae]|uniref:hypothetical protein n=1 Tax=Spirosoma oryzae TaxID=1469603 RepID=UPI0014749C5D|nr:hypothetical protein [Spirosoma oryzae]